MAGLIRFAIGSGVILFICRYLRIISFPWDKAHSLGKLGEDRIAAYLKGLNAMGVKGKVYRNVYIAFRSGRSTELDIVYLTDKRVYVIESKNYSGMIFGQEEDKNWTVTYRNGKKYSLYNPLKQNYTHVSGLSSVVKIPESIIVPIVVFGDNADLTNVQSSRVIKVSQVQQFILADYNRRGLPVALSADRLNHFKHELNIRSHQSPLTKLKHILEIRKYHGNKNKG